MPGLAEPGRIDGKQYGIPWYAANRVVIYNKDLFAQAGITPRRRPATEWLADTDQAQHRRQPGHLPRRARTGTPSPDSSGTRAATSPPGRRRHVDQGALDTPQALRPAWTSTRSSRRSARAPRTPTRRSRCRPRSSPRATSPRSSPRPGGASAHREGQPGAQGQARLLPDPRQDRRQARRGLHRRLRPRRPRGLQHQDAAPTRSSRRWPARSGRPTWPRR